MRMRRRRRSPERTRPRASTGCSWPAKSPLAAAAAKAAAPATKAKADAAIEGAGPPRSGLPSSAGIAVPSADDLRKELFAVYRPDQEPLGQFLRA